MHYSVQFDTKDVEYVADNIDISGFKYVLRKDISKIRRFVWLLAILTASAWMIWNIQGRVTYFLSRPSAITTEMKLKDELMFPKVTICNQNMFSSSKIFTQNNVSRTSPTVYEAIDRYLRVLRDDSRNQSLRQSVINKYGTILSNKNVTEFYRRAAHQKTSMIQRCIWKGELCGPQNFTEVFTNMGVCYQFNITADQMMDRANKDDGLSLILFVEQYDYMQDPQTSPGALVVITNQNETEALAEEQGIKVTVGQSVSIGLQQSETTDLPHPYGECGTAELDSYPPGVHFTHRKCQLNCLTSFIKRKCGCVSIYMPGSDTPICTLLRQLQCALASEELFYETRQADQCDCPSPCKSVSYSLSMSTAPFSDPFLQGLALDDPPVSLSDANRATVIQAWGLLNTMNSDITDRLALIGATLVDQKKAWDKYSSIMSSVVSQVRYLMEFVSEHSMTHDVMTEIQPKQEVNVSWLELDDAVSDVGVMLDYEHLSQDMDSGNIDMIVVRDILEFGFDKILYSRFMIEFALKSFFQHHSLIFNFISVVINEMHSMNISKEDLSTLTEDIPGLASELDMITQTLFKQETELTDKYKSEMDSLGEIVNQPYYFTLPSSFYRANLLKLEIYFKGLGVQELKKSPAYSAEGLVCDIGGSIGLCLGGSILTLFEFFDILGVLCTGFTKRMAGKTDSIPSVQREVG